MDEREGWRLHDSEAWVPWSKARLHSRYGLCACTQGRFSLQSSERSGDRTMVPGKQMGNEGPGSGELLRVDIRGGEAVHDEPTVCVAQRQGDEGRQDHDGSTCAFCTIQRYGDLLRRAQHIFVSINSIQTRVRDEITRGIRTPII